MFIDFTKEALSYVAFPGLGIEEFAVNRIAFTLNIGNNSIDVYWYGLIITLGIVAVLTWMRRLPKLFLKICVPWLE